MGTKTLRVEGIGYNVERHKKKQIGYILGIKVKNIFIFYILFEPRVVRKHCKKDVGRHW